jgi:tagatose 1,6-diphosphate aldolase GatY/KbaY
MTGHWLLEELQDAWKSGRAVAAVNVYDAVQAAAVADAAHAEDRSVILQTGSSSFSFVGEASLAAAVLAVRDGFARRLGVHLDHSRDMDEITRCLQAGYDSVMIDASHLPLEDNIERTRAVVSLARQYGAWVEAELGALPGEEDRSIEAGAGVMTDPADAARFVEATGVDLLAVAVGNVHGVPATPVHLCLARLEQIRDAVDVPLVLHGASGLPDDQILAAIKLGVAKINVNTEVRRAYLRALRSSLISSDSDDLTGHFGAARAAASAAVRSKIRLFATTNTSRETEAPR